MKVTKNNIVNRYQAFGSLGPLSAHNESAGTEPVHMIVAERQASAREQPDAQRQTQKAIRQDAARLPGEERRKRDRRQQQVNILLDTRVTPSRRQHPSIDEKA
ncbi:MAG: hypothetical protein LBI87_04510 [Candidatus Accumulibacter sp.]|nr:hypothetical protein [Accumulibacter sp.]